MRVYEYEAKDLFRNAGLPVPASRLAHDPEAVFQAAADLGGRVVLKPQTLLKARGKAGLIVFAASAEEAVQSAAPLFGREHAGERVEAVLVEEQIEPLKELFVGLVPDYAWGRPLLLAGAAGGVEIERTAAESPQLIHQAEISPSAGLTAEQAEHLSAAVLKDARLSEAGLAENLAGICRNLYRLYVDLDCEMAEINPLVVTREHELVALDAALSVDDDALFRQTDLVRPRAQSREDFERDQEFRRRGWTYLPLDGDIGILSSGAGITMVILDLMRQEGGRPANFLDTAQMRRQDMYDAFQIFYPNTRIKTVLVHIFAGLNRCDDLAEGIRDFLRDYTPHFNIVVRMIGNKEEEGRAILETIGIQAFPDLEQAVSRAIAVTKEQS